MRSLRASLILLVVALLTAPLMLLQQLLLWIWPSCARHLPKHYHRLLAKLLGIRIKVIGPPIEPGPALLVPNHASWLDVIIMSAVAPVSFVAKQEVSGWPLFGTLARLQRTIFVERSRRTSTGLVRDSLQQRLMAGDAIVLFAEGTSGDGVSVLPFKSSFFDVVDKTAVTLYPVTIAYKSQRNLPMTRRQRPYFAWYGSMALKPHLWQFLRRGPLEVEVIIHRPVTSDKSLNRKMLARDTEETIRHGLVSALHGSPDGAASLSPFSGRH